MGLDGLAPAQVAIARLSFGIATLVTISASTRTPLPRGWSQWKHVLVIAVLCVVPFILCSWAEQHLSSGLASIHNATTP